MKRIIKFRGKDKKTGKWVYGDLTHSKGINAEAEKLTYDRVMVAGYEVEEETVGLFTGVLDTNGKEIYEGDIIKDIYNDISKIVWDEEAAGMYILSNGIYSTFKDYEYERVKVIGNIFDNPELIKYKGE